MFEKFGEMSSYKELNELADNLFNEGDVESLKEMAKENGIGSEYVEMYLQGEIPELCDSLTAALGKIDVETEELKPKEIMEDWVEYLRGQCMENEILAHKVRKKGKSLKGWQETASPGSDEEHGNKNECSTEKRTMENPKGPADDGREEEKNDSKRTEADQELNKEIDERENAVQTQENKGEERIAPAQKTAEILSTEHVAEEQIEGQMNVADYPEIIPENMQTQQSVVEETITRKEYLDTLTEYGAAEYLYKYLKSETLANKEALEQWFKTEVDKKWGMEVEQGE